MSTHLTGVDSEYALRSLHHETKMLALYRRQAAANPALRRAWVNACCRAAAFEWVLSQDCDKVELLWREAVHVLQQSCAAHSPNTRPETDQLLLGLHLALITREAEAFRSLAHFATQAQSLRTARQPLSARATTLSKATACWPSPYWNNAWNQHLGGIAIPPRGAVQWCQSWRRHAPNLLAAGWWMAEHRAVCMLLKAVTEIILQSDAPAIASSPWLLPASRFSPEPTPPFSAQFALAMDDALLRWKSL
ncbi:MAG: hypothetical protein U0Y68_09910 [Blastocatellia bacterium]